MVLVRMNVFFHHRGDCHVIWFVGFSNPKNSILLPKFWYTVCIESYYHVNKSVKISCLDRNDFRTIKLIKILSAISNSLVWNLCMQKFISSSLRKTFIFSFFVSGNKSVHRILSLYQEQQRNDITYLVSVARGNILL